MTSDRYRIRFSLPRTDSGDTTAATSIPNYSVDIYDKDSHFVTRGTLRKGVELAPGADYFLAAALPDGRRCVARFAVEPQDAEIELRPECAAELPLSGTIATEDPVASSPHDDADTSNSLFSWPLEAYVSARSYLNASRVFAYAGNLLQPKKSLLPHFTLKPDESVASRKLSGIPSIQHTETWQVTTARRGITYVQLVVPGQPVRNYAVPVEPGRNCGLRVLRTAAGPAIDLTLNNADADLLLRYAGSKMYQEAAEVAESPSVLADELLQGKVESPIGAAVGAYALLRGGDPERLRSWAQVLAKSFPWLPDGVAILAEHLARSGRHVEALHELLLLSERGLPIFSSGLSYALNRLRQYQSARNSTRPSVMREISAEMAQQIDAVIAQLSVYASFTDFSRPILTFAGIDPLSPQRAAVGLFASMTKSVAVSMGLTAMPTQSLFRDDL